MAKIMLKVRVAESLLDKLRPILEERGMTVDQAVGLYLRGMVNSSPQARALRLVDVMPFGKYNGESVETVARAEPSYIQFIMGLGKTRFDADVFALIEKLTERKK